ncbi:cytochrome P450 714C2-like [Pyrus ussuriensis x Pyrus communis]|uniref:Cytochrome P450 714C2-like n=1 Tax=Pyrus ussuriensis x Pyrus communis TaxID=2448454 RepID=A0A5N5EXI2_9ROSA|nr:cytochrome P450 714C2-like [Pyrus ussuriensis x Pyrus communis]
MAAAKIVLSTLLGGFVILFLFLYETLLEKQGIRGPPSSSIIFGNIPDMKRFKLEVMKKSTAAEPSSSPISKDHRVSISHEWHSTLFPHLVQWRNEYGPIFMYSTGIIQHVSVSDLDMLKELSLTYLNLGKPAYKLSKDRKPLLGQGILSSNGPIWSHQRKIIAPEFYSDKHKIESKGGSSVFRVDNDLRSLSADIISRVSFGSNYLKGEEVFLKLRTLQKIISNGNIGVPGASFIVDNCKSIYFAGHETTAVTASWSLMSLATHPEWQARVRAEVLEIFRDGIPDADMFRSMKTLHNIVVPKGTNIQIPVPILQQLPDVWGPDALQFNPKRFKHGIVAACKSPEAYLPFAFGPRICVILFLILSKFCFSLSPAYQHSPACRLVIEPEHGVILHLKRV